VLDFSSMDEYVSVFLCCKEGVHRVKMHDSQRGSRMLKSERVSVLPYTYISHICIAQFLFRPGSKVASRQMRPETRVGPRVKCPLHLQIVTKIRKCGRNLIERTKAK